MVNDQLKTFSINLNVRHVNGMTPFDLAVLLLDTLESRVVFRLVSVFVILSVTGKESNFLLWMALLQRCRIFGLVTFA